MEEKDKLNWWDKYDRERWITAIIIAVFISLLSVIVLKQIPIPEIVKISKTFIEDFVFLDSQGKKEHDKQVPVYKEKDPGGIDYNGEVFHMIPDPTLVKDPLDPSISPVPSFALPPKTPDANVREPDISPDDIYNNREIDEPIEDPVKDIGIGVVDNTNVPSGRIININDTTKRPPIIGNTNTDFHFNPEGGLGSSHEISYSDFTDPLLNYIEEHQRPTGKISDNMLKNNDKNMMTTQLYAILNGKKFEVLLSGRKDTRQVNVFLIDTETDSLIYLIVHGPSRKKSKTQLGKVRRGANGEIIELNYEQIKIDNPFANSYLLAFLKWAKRNIYPKKF